MSSNDYYKRPSGLVCESFLVLGGGGLCGCFREQGKLFGVQKCLKWFTDNSLTISAGSFVRSLGCSTYNPQPCLDPPKSKRRDLVSREKLHWKVTTLRMMLHGAVRVQSGLAAVCARLGTTNAQVWQSNWPRRVWICGYHARWVSGWRACGGGLWAVRLASTGWLH